MAIDFTNTHHSIPKQKIPLAKDKINILWLQNNFDQPNLQPWFKNKDNHIDRTNAWRVLKRAANKVGIENFGTHSMRKTLAYYIYKSTKNISLVMKMLNHQNPSVTLRYIGVDQDMIDSAYEEYSI